MASTMDKIKNKVEQVTHTGPYSNKTHDTTTGTAGTTGTGAGSTNAGPQSSNIANKIDPRVDSDLDNSGNAGLSTHNNAGRIGLTGSSNTAGPHGTDLGNRMDPRVDSDLDGSRNLGASSTGASGYGTTRTTGTSNYNDPQSTNAGPHSSNIANKLDPRVDSDRDGSRNMGASGYGTGSTGHGNTGLTGTTHSTTAGPHSSNLANKLDPRVDSDRDGSRNMGATGTNTGSTGYGTGSTGYGNTGLTGTTHSTTAGPHSSNIANKVDPRVDSDLDGSRNMGATGYSTGQTGTGYGTGHTGTGLTGTSGTTGHHAPGSAQTTAGPHKSDILNKLDPRVDSDRDGSRTAGGSTTY